MKKIFTCLTLSFMLGGRLVVAQDTATPPTTDASTSSSGSSLKSKRGAEILPQAGDWALGISASNTLSYFGNLLNGNTANGANAPFQSAGSPFIANGSIGGYNIFGKKFIDAKSAYRVRLNLALGSESNKYDVLEDVVIQNFANPSYVQDYAKNSQSGLLLGLGKEMRRGSHRVQGVYGAEALIGLSSSSSKNEYGNPLNLAFNNPTSAIPGGGVNALGERMLTSKNAISFFLGARAFIGAEYFFAPKMSIGGEFGYTLGYKKTGSSTVTYEKWDPLNAKSIEVTREETRNANRFAGISTDNLNAALNLFLYF